MSDHSNSGVVTAKVMAAWIGAVFGSITLSQVVLWLTAVYTALNIFFLVRDKWWREKRRKR